MAAFWIISKFRQWSAITRKLSYPELHIYIVNIIELVDIERVLGDASGVMILPL